MPRFTKQTPSKLQAPCPFNAVMLVGALCILSSGTAQAGDILTSIYPLYLIAAAVTQGIETPHLLIPAGQDGHHIQLTPANRRDLQQADLVLWVGPSYEAPLAAFLTQKLNSLALLNVPSIVRRPMRSLNGAPIAHSIDPHIWLDPQNAIRIAYMVASVRGKQQPQHATAYQKNAAAFGQSLQSVLKQQIIASPIPYWSYHDAYQYLEPTLKLTYSGSLTQDPELAPTVGQIEWLRTHRPTAGICLWLPGTMGVPSRLQPVHTIMLDEVLPAATSYIGAWQTLFKLRKQCG